MVSLYENHRLRKIMSGPNLTEPKQIKFNRRYLDFHEIFESKPAQVRKSQKMSPDVIKKKGKYIPPPDHPWKRHNPRLHHNYYLERI